MIKRYSSKNIEHLWSEEFKIQRWINVEASHLMSLEKEGVVPEGTHKALSDIVVSDKLIASIAEEEKATRHDVVAFINVVERSMGEHGRWLHYGLTSSDVVDTALALQILQSVSIVEESLKNFIKELEAKALRHKSLPVIGRTHGVHAEPTTLGSVFLSFASEARRNLSRLRNLRDEIGYGKLSGPVGTCSYYPLHVQDATLSCLGLKAEPVPTQVVPRDRHAVVVQAMGVLASSLERFAIQIRSYHRTEIGEVMEGFAKDQKGSSSMPHKKNPISSENVCGIVRVIRSHCMPFLENIPLWDSRDISHSSVERVIFPDLFHLVVHSLDSCTTIVKNLEVNEDAIKKNFGMSKGLVFSGHLMSGLIRKGCSRQEAHKIVGSLAEKVRLDEEGTSMKILSVREPEIQKYMSKEDTERCFDIGRHLSMVSNIFKAYFDSVEQL